MLKKLAKIFKEIVYLVIKLFKNIKIIFLVKMIKNRFLEVDRDLLVQNINLNK